MFVRRNWWLLLPIVAIITLYPARLTLAGGFSGGFHEAWGPRYDAQHNAPSPQPPPGVDAVRSWNEIALDASGLDNTPVTSGENRVFGEQFGPTRASRALAIVHIAIFEAVNVIAGGYQSYTDLSSASNDTSMNAAIAQAAHDTLGALFPSQTVSFDARLAETLSLIPDGGPKVHGIDLGRRAAAAILKLRAEDGSQYAEPYIGVNVIISDESGKWRQDPISQIPLALGAYWGEVAPFALGSADQFRVPPPPALDSAAYAAAFDEVKRLGGDGVVTSTERTAEQT
jgi:hypothetical protein